MEGKIHFLQSVPNLIRMNRAFSAGDEARSDTIKQGFHSSVVPLKRFFISTINSKLLNWHFKICFFIPFLSIHIGQCPFRIEFMTIEWKTSTRMFAHRISTIIIIVCSRHNKKKSEYHRRPNVQKRSNDNCS